MAIGERTVVAFLRSDAGFQQVCGGRIYGNVAPQRRSLTDPNDPGAFPHCTYTVISATDTGSNDGDGTLVRTHLQLDAWALSYDDAKDVQDAVHDAVGASSVVVPASASFAAFDGFRGTVGGNTVQMITVEDERDMYEAPVHADEVGVHRVSMDVIVWAVDS